MRRFVTSLLVGGAASATVLIGSLKVNSILNEDEKLDHYRKVAASFAKYRLTLSTEKGEYYLPDYLDDETWKHSYETKHIGSGHKEEDRKDFEKAFPNWESFRNYCYEKGAKDDEKCNNVSGWCIYCARNNAWTWDSQRNK